MTLIFHSSATCQTSCESVGVCCEVYVNTSYRKKPNLIVHLDVSPEESLRRIHLRSRDCELGIKLEYLQDLHKAYEEFLKDIARIIPVIRVNYEQFRTAEEMADMIVRLVRKHNFLSLSMVWYREYADMTSVRYVDFKQEEKSGSKVSTTPSTITVEQ